MISVDTGQLTSFASQDPSFSVAIHRDASSENDMTDEESTVASLVQPKTLTSEHFTPSSVDSFGSKIGPLSRHKSRTSCDGDIDDTDSEVSPAGSFLHESCNPSSLSIGNSADSAISVTIPRPPSESESPLDGLFLICEALERPSRRSGSTGTDRSSEISSPANSPLSGSPTQKPSLMSLRTAQPLLLPKDLSICNSDSKYCDSGCNLFGNIPALQAPPLPDTYQQYSHHHIYHHHDMHQQQDIIIQPCNNTRWMPIKSTVTNKAVQNRNNVHNNTNSNINSTMKNANSKSQSNGANISHFPLSTLFTAAEALLPGSSDKKAQINTSAVNNSKSTKRAYKKRADEYGNRNVATSKLGASTASIGKKNNTGRKQRNVSEKALTEKDIESKKRKREADRSLSSKKRYDASEKLAVVVEKLRKYFAMELHKL